MNQHQEKTNPSFTENTKAYVLIYSILHQRGIQLTDKGLCKISAKQKYSRYHTIQIFLFEPTLKDLASGTSFFVVVHNKKFDAIMEMRIAHGPESIPERHMRFDKRSRYSRTNPGLCSVVSKPVTETEAAAQIQRVIDWYLSYSLLKTKRASSSFFTYNIFS